MKSTVYQRSEGVTMQEMDGDLFLANEENGSIYHLNNIGAAFWRMLENTCDQETIIGLFIAAFPHQSRTDLIRDIDDLVNQLEEQGLIIRKVS
jgi:hypothetical protein